MSRRTRRLLWPQRAWLLTVVACLGIWTLGTSAAEKSSHSGFAVTTSYLECCLRDLAGPQVKVVRLCPPGTCPGHFDLRPDAFQQLRSCRALLLFDFQKAILTRLGGVLPSEVILAPIAVPPGLCVPEHYLQACRGVHEVLVKSDPQSAPRYDAALAAVEKRLEKLARTLRDTTRQSSGTRVIASAHQAAFCRWLGLEVVATFSSAELASPAHFASLVRKAKKAKARLVVANLQEGEKLGETLAGELGVKLVVFSNFPSMQTGQASFDALVQDNARRVNCGLGISDCGLQRHRSYGSDSSDKSDRSDSPTSSTSAGQRR